MKKIVLMAATAFLMYACTQDNINSADSTEPNQLENAAAGQTIPGKYIVRLKPDAAIKGKPDAVKAKVADILSRNGAAGMAVDFVYSHAIQGFTATIAPGLLKKLEADGSVEFIEADQVITLGQKTTGKPGGGGSTQPAQTTPWGIDRVGGAGNGAGKTAWIIDTGIDLTHPDLNVDGSRGFSAFTSGRDAGVNDGNGHGTHVAGTIAALNNAIGVVGVAAGATVVPVKVLGSRGTGSNSGVIAGIDFVAAHGQPGDVANMSLGGGVSTALDQAVLNAAQTSGVKFALAAGNETDNANNHSPARVNGTNIWTVSAHDINDAFAYFSNYGNPPIDVCAPGVSIKSTWMGGGYNTISGTSMATPHVAGILLLGNVSVRGKVSGDPDGNSDDLASR